MTVEEAPVELRLGPPSTPDEAYYSCDWCCIGLSGPAVKKPTCPSCGRSGDGVYRLSAAWVKERFDEAAAIAQVRERSRQDGLTSIPVLAQRIREARKPFIGGNMPATTKDKPKMTEETKAKLREKKPKEKKPCVCGCGTLTGGSWAPGHDARFYAAVKKVRSGDMTAADLSKQYPSDTIKNFSERAH